MREYRERWGQATATWIGVGVAYGVLLVIFAFVAPVFNGSWGFSSTNTDTLVGHHGLYGAFVLAVPLIFALAIAASLLESDKRGARSLAWSLWGVLAVATLAGILTIGVLVIPLTIAMFLACRLYVAPKQRHSSVGA